MYLSYKVNPSKVMKEGPTQVPLIVLGDHKTKDHKHIPTYVRSNYTPCIVIEDIILKTIKIKPSLDDSTYDGFIARLNAKGNINRTTLRKLPGGRIFSSKPLKVFDQVKVSTENYSFLDGIYGVPTHTLVVVEGLQMDVRYYYFSTNNVQEFTDFSGLLDYARLYLPREFDIVKGWDSDSWKEDTVDDRNIAVREYSQLIQIQ